jgi:ATP-dependent Clp protease protease subunit
MDALKPFPDPRNQVQYQRTREMTIDELLLENRVVFLVGEITYASAARVMMQMLYLEDQRRGQDINLYINSPGGSLDDTLAVYDTMQFLSSDVATYCIGRAYSGGAVLLCAGTAGKRHILPHAKVMIHQPYGGVTGQTTDIQIQAEQIIKAKLTLNEIIAPSSRWPRTATATATSPPRRPRSTASWTRSSSPRSLRNRARKRRPRATRPRTRRRRRTRRRAPIGPRR